LGSESEDDGLELKSSILQKLAGVVEVGAGGVMSGVSGLVDAMGSVGSAAVDGVGKVGHYAVDGVGKVFTHQRANTEDSESSKNAGKPVEPVVEEWHWGVPYKFDVKLLMCRRLTFYVKDFLAASHTDHKPIVIKYVRL
jgi:hypothetical protein